MSAPDWELVEKVPNRFKSMAPKRDIVGQRRHEDYARRIDREHLVHAGSHGRDDLLHVPGARPRQSRERRLFRRDGAGLRVPHPDWSIKNLQKYIDSQRHLAAKAKETGATVLLSNHSEFDEAYKKNRMLAGRGNGPHPYEIGADWVQRYFKVTENCARATQLKLEQQVAESR